MTLLSHSEEMYRTIARANMTTTLTGLSPNGETKQEAGNYNTGRQG